MRSITRAQEAVAVIGLLVASVAVMGIAGLPLTYILMLVAAAIIVLGVGIQIRRIDMREGRPEDTGLGLYIRWGVLGLA